MNKLFLMLSLLTLNSSIMPMHSIIVKLRKPMNHAAMLGVRNVSDSGVLLMISSACFISSGVIMNSINREESQYGEKITARMNEYMNKKTPELPHLENEVLKQIILKQQNEIESLKKQLK